jgi:hypothetical protein
MFNFKMSETPNCPRCGMIESHDHLLWECRQGKKIWGIYNETLKELNWIKWF